MKRFQQESTQVLDTQLERVVEPLASYISAASRPRAALLSALAVLSRVVEETNTAADAHVAALLDNRWCGAGRSATQLRSAI